MWNRLKQVDIEQARQQLDLRRDEALRKHAEEMQILAADQAAIDTLDHLAGDFSRKFNNSRSLPDFKSASAANPPPTAISPDIASKSPITVKPVAASKSPITVKPATAIKPNEHRVSHRHSTDKPAPKVSHSDRQGHRTNFETYVHAMVKNERGW
jgi:hypothetical protein